MDSTNNLEETAGAKAPSPARPPVALVDLQVYRAEDGRFRACWAGYSCGVRVAVCFPWTAPGAYISLRDDDDKEVALIPSLDDVDEKSRRVLEQALRETSFAFEITHVVSIRKEFEIRQWEVACTQGLRTFQTKMDDYPQVLPEGALLITDVGGDVYVIQDWTALDKQSRKQLAMFVD